MLIKYRNIGHKWQFAAQSRQALQQYHDANKLLVDCLQSDGYTTRAVRQEIEETLLLPISPISPISPIPGAVNGSRFNLC